MLYAYHFLPLSLSEGTMMCPRALISMQFRETRMISVVSLESVGVRLLAPTGFLSHRSSSSPIPETQKADNLCTAAGKLQLNVGADTNRIIRNDETSQGHGMKPDIQDFTR